jgi:hypothetical protein
MPAGPDPATQISQSIWESSGSQFKSINISAKALAIRADRINLEKTARTPRSSGAGRLRRPAIR